MTDQNKFFVDFEDMRQANRCKKALEQLKAVNYVSQPKHYDWDGEIQDECMFNVTTSMTESELDEWMCHTQASTGYIGCGPTTE